MAISVIVSFRKVGIVARTSVIVSSLATVSAGMDPLSTVSVTKVSLVAVVSVTATTGLQCWHY